MANFSEKEVSKIILQARSKIRPMDVSYVEQLESGSNWFPFFRPFSKVMSKITALFFQDLLNRRHLVSQSSAHRVASGKSETVDAQGFFLCSRQFLQDESMGLIWSDDEQKHQLKVLQDKGFVTVERRGIPAMRWIRINTDRVREKVVAAQSVANDPDKSMDPPPPNRVLVNNCSQSVANDPDCTGAKDTGNRNTYGITEKETKSLTNSGAFAPSFDGETTALKTNPPQGSDMREGFGVLPTVNNNGGPSSFDLTIASRLREVLRTNRIPVTNKRAVSSWAKQVTMLRSVATEDQIDSAMSWYAANIGQRGAPEIQCGKSFRTKFAKLLSAMKRSWGEAEPTPLTDEDKKIAADLATWNWPEGLKKDLPTLVATVRKQYAAIRSKCLKFVECLPAYSDGRPKDAFAQTVHSFATSLPSSTWFVKDWAKAIQSKVLFAVGNHGGWKGNLLKTHGTLLGSDRFEGWASQVAKSQTKWNKIKKEVLS